MSSHGSKDTITEADDPVYMNGYRVSFLNGLPGVCPKRVRCLQA